MLGNYAELDDAQPQERVRRNGRYRFRALRLCDRVGGRHEPNYGLESAHRVDSRDVIGDPKADA